MLDKQNEDRIEFAPGRVGASEKVEITPAMIDAGVRAANLISYEWGSTPEGNLVSPLTVCCYPVCLLLKFIGKKK